MLLKCCTDPVIHWPDNSITKPLECPLIRGHSQAQRSKIKLFQWCSVVQDVEVYLVAQSVKV
jgi:hypothetical protein